MRRWKLASPTAFISLDPREVKSAMIKDNEEAILIETGRMAARLIHDFKNQLGGLKLYAAYLQSASPTTRKGWSHGKNRAGVERNGRTGGDAEQTLPPFGIANGPATLRR